MYKLTYVVRLIPRTTTTTSPGQQQRSASYGPYNGLVHRTTAPRLAPDYNSAQVFDYGVVFLLTYVVRLHD